MVSFKTVSAVIKHSGFEVEVDSKVQERRLCKKNINNNKSRIKKTVLASIMRPFIRVVLTFNYIIQNAGLEPMGLFWSLQPLPGQKLGTSYRYTDVTTPDQLLLTVHVGHLNAKELLTHKPVAETTIRRHFLADNVERIPIRHGRIQGIVYKPKGMVD